MDKRWTSDFATEARNAPAQARVPAEFHIGPIRIAPATVLAPMAGVTDTVFRRFIKNASMYSAATAQRSGLRVQSADPLSSGPLALDPGPSSTCVEDATSNESSGCGLIMTEFTSADGLSRMRESKRKRYLTYYEDEHPISAQLFGSNPVTLSESAKVCQDAGFDIVDLNLGCPAKRVVACNGGSGLLRDLPKIREIFEAVRAAVSIPFTVKFRMGWNDSNIVCVELAKMAEDCGLNAVALHARTREQGYAGEARWEWIASVKDAVMIPVIGNGDIRTPEDAVAMVAATHCDAVMIGRAAPGNPWIFRQIAEYTASQLATGVGTYTRPTDADRYRMIRDYFDRLMAEVEEHPNPDYDESGSEAEIDEAKRLRRHHESAQRDAIGKMKQFASWFTHGVPGGAALRRGIFDSKRGAEVMSRVDDFFAEREKLADKLGSDALESQETHFTPEPDAELDAAPAAWG
jgi:nifR3 family TIM-barrel protein